MDHNSKVAMETILQTLSEEEKMARSGLMEMVEVLQMSSLLVLLRTVTQSPSTMEQ